jgi:hypothetical protein
MAGPNLIKLNNVSSMVIFGVFVQQKDDCPIQNIFEVSDRN